MMEKKCILYFLFLLPFFMVSIKISIIISIFTSSISIIDKGVYCNRTWDGWLCWNDVAAGTESMQLCPDYFQDFDPSEKVTKICDQDGNWFRHPASNRTWTNYTQCTVNTHEKVKTALNLFYLTIIGHGLSIASLLVSLGIFFYFKSLSCQRITLHKNLFFSFVCNSVVTIIHFTAVANNQALVATNPVSCKVSQFIHLYLMGCNYFWMLCEGIYLHTLIVVAVFAEKQHLMWYYFLGWGFPLIPACIHAIARSLYYNDNCWISSDTHLLYIIHGPICAALLVCIILISLLSSSLHHHFNYIVQAILRRNWNQYKIQFGNSFSHSDALRSASYTVSTISDIPGYSHDCPSEHLNGKSFHDVENVILKPEKLYD
uniref:Calcitonin receptor like receptor n=1 Tax=Propithecus coquereli TaxID=379532 RepID=A0A2K6EVZ4_PROCO